MNNVSYNNVHQSTIKMLKNINSAISGNIFLDDNIQQRNNILASVQALGHKNYYDYTLRRSVCD